MGLFNRPQVVSNEQKKLIDPAVLAKIEEDLIQKYPQLIVKGLMEEEKRKELVDIIKKEHSMAVKDSDLIAEYLAQEIVGTGIIEEIMQGNEDVTDIGFCGKYLTVEGNNRFERIEDEKIDEKYIQRIVQKFASAVGKDFSPKNPRFKAVFENLRISAIHSENSNSGTTLSLRIVRPKLALAAENFKNFAPDFMLEFLKASVLNRSNILIAGETGSGKTELQKLAFSFIKNHQKVVMIEDVPETFVKVLFPEKYVYSWLTGNGITHNMLIEDAMRNNARWIFVSEIVNSAAYGLYQAMISGHNIITTLHAIDGFAMPKRMAQLAKFAPEAVSVPEENMIEDILRYMDFGWHIKREEYNGKIYRYLHQVVAYAPNNESYAIFEQEFYEGVLKARIGHLPEDFKDALIRKGIPLEFPENTEFTTELSSEESEEVVVA